VFHFTGMLTRPNGSSYTNYFVVAQGVSSINDAGGSSTNYIVVVRVFGCACRACFY
jgi:hypothetical protein